MSYRGSFYAFLALLSAVHIASAQTPPPGQWQPQPQPQPQPPPQVQPMPAQPGAQPAPAAQPQPAPNTGTASFPAPGGPPATAAPAPAPAAQAAPEASVPPQTASQPMPAASSTPAPPPLDTPAPQPSPDWSVSDTRFILAAERLFGFYILNGTASEESGGETVDTDLSSTQINLLFTEATDDVVGLNPMAIPYLSAYGVIAGGVTLGGGIGAAFDSGEQDPEGGPAEDQPDRSLFLIGPRVGYLLRTSDSLSIWFRGGFSYYSAKATLKQTVGGLDFKQEVTQKGTFLNLDPMLVFTPVPHIGLLLGPVVDIGLSGSADQKLTSEDPFGGSMTETNKVDLTWTQFGLVAGLAALF